MDLYHLIKILFPCFSSSQRSHVSGEDFVSLKKNASDPNVRFAFTWSCLQEGSCLIYVICVCLRIMVSYTYCVVFFVLFVFVMCLVYLLLSVSLDCSFFIDHSVSLTFIVILLSKCLNYIHVKRERRLDHKPQRYTFI